MDAIDFAVIRDHLEIQDSSLSKHLKVLAGAGYVALRKESSISRRDARRITWITLTRSGKEAFDTHVKRLTDIARGAPD